MNHIEAILVEYYDWQGYFVKSNTRVGRLPRGGWTMELDVVAFDPRTNNIFHVEPSLDGSKWSDREQRYAKKFDAGRKYIPTELFPWLVAPPAMTQLAILPQCGPKRRTLAGAQVMTVDEMMGEIKRTVAKQGIAATGAIPERYPLLRTIQFAINGLCRVDDPASTVIRLTSKVEAANVSQK